MKKNPNKIIQGFFSKKDKFDLVQLYHNFMVTYGYIPLKEFLDMDSFVVVDLVSKINKDREKNKSGFGGY